MRRLDAYFFSKLRENIHFEKYPDTCGLGLRLENTIYNVLLNNKTFNFRDIKKHPSIQFSPLIDGVLSLIKYKNKYGSFSFYRLYRENQRQLEEKRRERLLQEELARQRAAQPKPWRPKQLRKRKANYCGRLQKW